MIRACASLLVLVGCGSVFDLEHVTLRADAAPQDVAIDARLCFGSALVNVCLVEPVEPLATIGAIDTSNDGRCQVASQTLGPELCVIGATSITLMSPVIATGSRPLVLVARETITVASLIDVSSTFTRTGAAVRNDCASPAGASAAAGGAGGAGGTSGFAGGTGGSGGGTAGTASRAPDTTLLSIAGGCSGGEGGTTGSGTGAAAGRGGGAVYLLAGTEIVVSADGVINASGAPGRGGTTLSGGGGGGAGGLIGLEAPVVRNSGNVFARGGGAGGGGSDVNKGGDGQVATDPVFGASGGPGGSNGANFGAPGCGGPEGGVGGFAPQAGIFGGGGGGGGCGYIRVHGAFDTTTPLSPARTP